MKLQRHISDKKGNKVYRKYVVVISDEEIDKANFKEGDELVAETKLGEIRLKKVGR